MPFTPFHMGAALLLKPVAQRRFSVIAFGLAQIAMDIEPLLGMVNGWDTLHGWTHTVIGALCIAPVAGLATPYAYGPLIRRYNREVRALKLPWLCEPEAASAVAVWSGAVIGTLSHVALDSLMHYDMHPLAPFSDANPLLGLIALEDVYRLCAWAGLIGSVIWLGLRWRRQHTPRSRPEQQPPR